MTSNSASTPVHGNLFSQMFVMAVDNDGETVVRDSSCFQGAHQLKGGQHSWVKFFILNTGRFTW